MNSKQKLSQALKDVNAPNYMIERAEKGYYSDFESELAMPMVQLVKDCLSLGFSNIAERAKDGEFDSTKEESDEWYEKEGKQLIQEMGIDPDKLKGQ